MQSNYGLQIYALSRHQSDLFPADVARIMLKATNEERGTVAGLTTLLHSLDDNHIDGMSSSL